MTTTAAEVRAQVLAEGLTARQGVAPLGRALALLAVYVAVASAALAVDRWWAWALAWVVMGFLLLGAVGALHESVHGNLAQRWRVNNIAGLLAAGLLLIPYDAYRWYHLAHHAATATPADPEGDNTVPSRLMYLLLPIGGVWFWGELWSHGIGALRGRPPRWVRTAGQRRSLRRRTVLAAVVLAAAVVGAVAEPLVWRLWIVPTVVLLVVFLPVVVLPEHYGAYGEGRGDPLDVTRTVVSNPVVRAVFWNTNFHAAHQFAPRVPAHRMGRLDVLVQPIQPPRWRTPSYRRWHWTLFRGLPWRAASAVAAADERTAALR